MNHNSQPEAEPELGRYIPSEKWDSLYVDIYRLYIDGTKPLDDIRCQMKRNHFFHATTKQWKEQLAKWSLKRNLSCADAAHILKLHLDAESRGGTVQIFFFNKRKTLANIRQYVKKSKELQVEDDLLGHLTPEIPYYIGIGAPRRLSCPTPTALTLNGSIMSTTKTVRSTFLPLPTTSRDSFGSQQTGSPWSMVEVDNGASQAPSPSFAGLSTPLDEGGALATFNGSDQEALMLDSLDNLAPIYKSLALDASSVNPTSLIAVTEPFVSPDSQAANLQCDQSFHGLMSASPIHAIGLPSLDGCSSDMNADPMRSLLGNFWDCEQFNIFSEYSLFLVSCIQGCIYLGQAQDGNAGRKFNDAIRFFLGAVTHHREECLTVLTVLVTLFESYGHRNVVKRILENVSSVMLDCFGRFDPMTRTVEFMQYTQSLESGRSGIYDIDELVKICDLLLGQYGMCSRLTLTAQYNYAWAQLENGNISMARHTLMELKPLCETAFGPLHLQTIICTATLARAQFKNGELQPAEALLDEVVLSRIRRVFTVSHPYHWEAQTRHAKFLIALSNKSEHVHAKCRNLRQKAEELLREVLLWRFTVLGTANPRTTDTFHTLARLLEIQSRSADARSLFSWCDHNCQFQRDLLMGGKYVLTGT